MGALDLIATCTRWSAWHGQVLFTQSVATNGRVHVSAFRWVQQDASCSVCCWTQQESGAGLTAGHSRSLYLRQSVLQPSAEDVAQGCQVPARAGIWFTCPFTAGAAMLQGDASCRVNRCTWAGSCMSLMAQETGQGCGAPSASGLHCQLLRVQVQALARLRGQHSGVTRRAPGMLCRPSALQRATCCPRCICQPPPAASRQWGCDSQAAFGVGFVGGALPQMARSRVYTSCCPYCSQSL